MGVRPRARPKERDMPTDMNENPMRGSLTDEQIARRNVIPTNNPAGEPHRILAE